MSFSSSSNPVRGELDDDEFFDSETELPLVQILINNEEPSTLKTNAAAKHMNTPTRPYTPIYAVQFKAKPNANGLANNLLSNSRIFINAETAMKLCKQDPEYRRFKVFKYFKEAYAFSYEAEIESGKAPTIEQVKASLSNLIPLSPCSNDGANNGDTKSPAITTNGNNTPSSMDAEKLPFSAPKKADINHLRLLVEKDDFEQFTDRIASNPRYLISAGDAPVVVQEAFRYNLLHTCAKSNRPQICEYVLNLLSSSRFIQRLYRNDTAEQSKARSNHLLDLYLNTPEKGVSETPLHFACKFGSYEVAKIFISFENCCKNPLNKLGKTPEEIICTHQTASKDKLEAIKIKNLFEEHLFVPLYRDDDRGDVKFDKPSPRLSKSLNVEPDFNYLRLNHNQLSPSLMSGHSQHKLAGYFGPISPTVAFNIYERLKTPARIRQSPIERDIVRGDDLKGYERIARKVTEEMNVPFHEYWSFLDNFTDIKTRDGLEKIEIYLRQKVFQSIIESQIKIAKEIKLDIESKASQQLTSNHEILAELTQFLDTSELIKTKFEMKENVLSEKYELFYKLMQVHSIKYPYPRLPLKFESSSSISRDLTEENENALFEYLINDLLAKYVAHVIELSRLDKTGKSHLNLYKPLKVLLELVNCNKVFEHFYLTPAFQRTFISNNLKAEKFEIKSKLRFDEDEDNKEKAKAVDTIKSENNDNSDDDDDNNYDDAEVSLLEELPISKDLNDDDLLSNFLSEKLGAIKLDANENHIPLMNITNNPFGGGVKTNVTKMDDKNFMRPSTINNNNNQFLASLMIKKQKVFMHGDAPSKLDRAVYLAIKDVSQEDLRKLNLLSEWLDFMKYCNPQEMQQWKTPKKPTAISRIRN